MPSWWFGCSSPMSIASSGSRTRFERSVIGAKGTMGDGMSDKAPMSGPGLSSCCSGGASSNRTVGDASTWLRGSSSGTSCVFSPTSFATIFGGVQLHRSLMGPKPRLLDARDGFEDAHSHSSLRRIQRPHLGCCSSHLTLFVKQVRQPTLDLAGRDTIEGRAFGLVLTFLGAPATFNTSTLLWLCARLIFHITACKSERDDLLVAGGKTLLTLGWLSGASADLSPAPTKRSSIKLANQRRDAINLWRTDVVRGT